MGLRLFSRALAFADALTASSGAVYSICNRDWLDPAQALNLELCAEKNNHQELLALDELRAEALSDIDDYFVDAAKLDPAWHYAYSSKIVLSIPDYQDLQKIFLLRRFFAKHPQREVSLLVPDSRLRRLFGEIFVAMPPATYPAFPGVRAWMRFIRTFLRAMANRPKTSRARVLIFSLSADIPAIDIDAYFGKFAHFLRDRAPTTTVYLASGPALALPQDSHKLPFEAFASGLDVIAAWIVAIVSGIRSYRAIMVQIGNDELEPLHRHMRGTEIRSGEHFTQQLFRRVFPRMLQEIAPEILLYPFENRSWEKTLLAAAKVHGVSRRIGYQHSSMTPRHLAFQVKHGDIPDEFLPDKIYTAGEFTADLLTKIAPALAGKLQTGISLRTARQAVPEPGAHAVLVAISSSRSEAWSLFQIAHAAASKSELRFILRTHPTISVKTLFGLFAWPGNVELSAGNTLAEDLSQVTMVAYSSSTVALEGMLCGRLPIFVDIGDLPNGDPVMGEHPFKFRVDDGAALANQIARILKLGAEEMRLLQAQARAFAERYLCDPTPEGMSRMAESMLNG